MAKSLIVVESPTKIKTIKKFLGRDFTIMASYGHVKNLPPKRLGVKIEDGFKPEYITIQGKSKVLKDIREAAKTAEKIFLAPDPDREGEAISWHIANELKAQEDKIYRVLFNEITKNAVKRGLEKPGRIDINKVNAQQTRRILDRLVGYQISPILWTKVKGGLSAGRVQSVAVRLICEREKQIKEFVTREYWTITAFLEGENPPQFSARVQQYKGKKITIPDKAGADDIITILKKTKFSVKKILKKAQKRRPPPPFITSTLQQEASRLYRFPAKRTMSIAQKLYEGKDLGNEGSIGLITYMRTDSPRIADEAISELRGYLKEYFDENYLPNGPRLYKSKKGAQEAHEAIRPTSINRTPEAIKGFLEKDEYNIYNLIWKRALASQMTDAIFDITTIDIGAGDYMLRATGSVIKFEGYLRLYQYKEKMDANVSKDEDAAILPPLKEGEGLILKDIEPKQHFTQPPPRYTEATLIRELEEKGIGRPSTYASILGTIINRDYVINKDRQLYPTELGFIITDMLVKNFPDVLNVEFTAMMEDRLDMVEDGKEDWVEALETFYKPFNLAIVKAKQNMKNVKKEGIPTDLTCDLCGHAMVIRLGRNGKFLACSNYPTCKNTKEYKITDGGEVVPFEVETVDQKCDKCGAAMLKRHSRYGDFLGCSAYPKCKNIIPLQKGAAPQESIQTEEKCEKCSSPMVIKNGRYGRFLACSNYPACKHVKPYSTGVKCPNEGCGGDLIEKSTKQGKMFYGCSKYPECNFAVWDRPIPTPCPKCGHPFILESTGKTPQRKCPNKNCGYKETI